MKLGLQSSSFTEKFKISFKTPFLGFITGPVTVVIGVALIALNAIGAIFSLIPSAVIYLCQDEKGRRRICEHPLFIKNCLSDILGGVAITLVGLFATLPGSSFAFKALEV